MDCTKPTSRNHSRIILKILIVVLSIVLVAVILFTLNKPKLNRAPRIEEMLLFDARSTVTTTAFTPEYMLSVVDDYSPELKGRMAWEPGVHRLILTNIATGEEKILNRFNSWDVFILSSGNTFYLFVDMHKDATESSEPLIHMVYSLNPKTETLEHLATFGPTDQSEALGAYPWDVVESNDLFYFIYPHSIQVFDSDKRSCEVLYTTEETLVNSYTTNRAKLYQNELFIVTDSGELYSIDVMTGKETGRRIYSTGISSKFNENSFNNLYWIWGDELIYQNATSKTMEAYNLINGKYRTLYYGIFSILFADEEGLFVNISDAGSNLFYFNPTEQTFEYLGAQENLPEKLMMDWVCENTYGKIRKWLYRDFLATPGEV